MYIYLKTESNLFTVGFYDPNGKFISESDHSDKEEAANRVAFLNAKEINREFSGSVKIKVKKGMMVRINPNEIEGKIHLGKLFIINSEVRTLCGTEVVSLLTSSGARFSAAYNLEMLEVTDAGV